MQIEVIQLNAFATRLDKVFHMRNIIMTVEHKKSKNIKYPSLDSILNLRFHGAISIKGIRYQILYSIYKTFEEYGNKTDFKIQLEGIEDLDLIGLNSNNNFIQVKTSGNAWGWAKYKEVLKSFYTVFCVNPKAQFYLIANFQHNNDWLKLTSDTLLPAEEESRLKVKVKSISNDLGIGNSIFYKNIKLITLREEELFSEIKKNIANIYSIAESNMADIFTDSLFSKFLEKAEKREYITKSFIDNIWIKINESLVRQREYYAFGEGLISKLEWQVDAKNDDFYDGKRVRSGHIESQLDVKRGKWLEQIDNGIIGSKICIIRASSGQGKSTLLYRYAHEYWDAKYIYILNSAQTIKEVELIKDFLGYLSKLELPILLLVDNADFQTSFWPEIAGFCSSAGIRVLITIRHEDWFRFSNPNITNYEIIQPELDFIEAREIYNIFSKQNRIHKDVVSYKWAFEKIGEPPLLLEYVYLLTHGEMLKERLFKQIKYISEHDDKVKIELLRLVSTADLLGSPIETKKLLENFPFYSDAKNVIESFEGEYIELRNGFIRGLHWIRSTHLADLLHGQISRLSDTAIKLLGLIPELNIANYISNTIVHKDIDNNEILNSISSNIADFTLKELEEIFKGFFIGGERLFFLHNKIYFQEAFNLIGLSAASLLGASTSPTSMINIIERISAINDNVITKELKIILAKVSPYNRGTDLCKRLAGLVDKNVISIKLTKETLLKAPNILYWLKLAEIKIDTSFFSTIFSDITDFERYDEKSIYKLLSGLYEYNHESYFNWYKQNSILFHSYLQYKTDTINLNIQNNELSIDFIPLNDDLSPNEQAVSRLNKYREALPFCSKYSSHCITLLPFGIEPTIKDTEKNIPVENLPLSFSVNLNRYWLDIIENYFIPDTFYLFEENHFKFRENLISYLSILVSFFRHVFVAKKYDIQKALNKENIYENLLNQIDRVPEPPKQCENRIRKLFIKAMNACLPYFRNFIFQFNEYFKQDRNNDIGRLALHNLKEYTEHLPDHYSSFNLVSSISMDYFDFDSLKSNEIELSKNLIELFEFYINNWKRLPIYNYEDQIKQGKEIQHKQIIQDIMNILANKNVFVADRVYLEYPLSYLPLYFSVDNPVFPENALKKLLPLFKKIQNKPSFYYLLPIFNDHLIIDGGYRIISTFDENNFAWETFVPHEVPAKVLELLPVKEKIIIQELSFKNDLLGCLGLIHVWIKQSEYLKSGKVDYFISQLFNKIKDQQTKMFKKLKSFLLDFNFKYTHAKDELQFVFHGLLLKELFLFVDKFTQIDSNDEAIDFLSDNFSIWKTVINYFGLIYSETEEVQLLG